MHRHPLRRLPQHAVAALLATAMAGAGAQTVNLYGLIDLSVGRTQAPGGAATWGVDSGKMTTSYFGLKGSEDLGGGLTANFAIEGFLLADTGASGRFTGDTFWSRSSWVGLGTPYGSINLGRNTTSLFVQTLIFNAVGDSFGFSPSIRHYFTSGTTTGDTAWNDSVKWSSPRWGGLSLSAHGALGEANGGRNAGLSALYFSGPLGAGFAWQKVRKGAAVADTTTWQLGASYALGDTKLFAQWGDVDNDTTGNGYRIVGLGATLTAGAGRFLAQWGRISPDTGATRTTTSVGYDYFLSKRTDAYLIFMNDKLGSATGNSYGLGVRHRF